MLIFATVVTLVGLLNVYIDNVETCDVDWRDSQCTWIDVLVEKDFKDHDVVLYFWPLTDSIKTEFSYDIYGYTKPFKNVISTRRIELCADGPFFSNFAVVVDKHSYPVNFCSNFSCINNGRCYFRRDPRHLSHCLPIVQPNGTIASKCSNATFEFAIPECFRLTNSSYTIDMSFNCKNISSIINNDDVVVVTVSCPTEEESVILNNMEINGMNFVPTMTENSCKHGNDLTTSITTTNNIYSFITDDDIVVNAAASLSSTKKIFFFLLLLFLI